ncbi:type VI secretion system baseplate subunit TssG [Microvirga sp. 0TCS3.31]
MSYLADLEAEPWRFDFFMVLRGLERSFPEHPRIGNSATLRDEYLLLGEDPYLDFPASTLSRVEPTAQNRIRMFVKFLGLLGPQGPLPLATTEEAYSWTQQRDDAFPRFLDIFNHRFLQLFFRAWADARPVSQHDRPDSDRFKNYLGSFLGIGADPYQQLDSVPDASKLAFAGIASSQTKSASRLQYLLAGLFNVDVTVDQFVGSWLLIEPDDRSCLGRRHCKLGAETLLGASTFSVQDKFRIRILAKDLKTYSQFLPTGDRCEALADMVFLYIGQQLDWDLELAIPANAAKPMQLGRFGQLGYTSWLGSADILTAPIVRSDARFYPEERLKKRGRSPHQ